MSWLGVDLDGTLAMDVGGRIGHIGAPVPRMVERVKEWIAQGREVRIVTARVGACGETNADKVADTDGFAEEQRAMIQTWCHHHLGVILPVTASKDFQMAELYDDRAVRIVKNTGMTNLEVLEDTIQSLMLEVRWLRTEVATLRGAAGGPAEN